MRAWVRILWQCVGFGGFVNLAADGNGVNDDEWTKCVLYLDKIDLNGLVANLSKNHEPSSSSPRFMFAKMAASSWLLV